MNTIAARMFDGHDAECELETLLADAGAIFDRLGWDHYDSSVELHGVPADYRLSIAVQGIIHKAGFVKAYINHVDKWETHYGFKPREAFTEAKGWRVSYPHKRGDDAKGIWVEEVCTTWPKEWFETGYCIVRPPSNDDGTKTQSLLKQNLTSSPDQGEDKLGMPAAEGRKT